MSTQFPPRSTSFDAPVSTGIWAAVKAWCFAPILTRMNRGIVHGTIEARLPDGSIRTLGDRGAGPVAILHINRWNALLRMASGGSVGGYEGWERGEWDSPDLVALFEIFMRNRVTLGGTARASGVSRLVKRLHRWTQRNDRNGAKRNVMAHYDLGNDFYAAWLDPSMSYSSARFAGEGYDLESAQRRKFETLSERIPVAPNSTLLEIGCGWGSFATHMAGQGHQVTAITISPAQMAFAQEAHGGPHYRLCDYRDIDGAYDGIASIEMVEAVGQEYWPDYLDTVARCLKPGGRAGIQFITINDDVFDRYASSADFIQTYIFPGGMLLSESRFRALAEERGLRWEAPAYFADDYARTLKLWRERFDAAVVAGNLPSQFDDQFIRLWRFYLMYCEGGFRGGGIDVGQVTLVKD
jgi:cyclopropane-fatty-acyl-phospholipid synthase